MMLFIWVPGPMGGDMGGGGGGTWKGLAGSLAATCLWPPGYMLGGAGGGPPRRDRWCRQSRFEGRWYFELGVRRVPSMDHAGQAPRQDRRLYQGRSEAAWCLSALVRRGMERRERVFEASQSTVLVATAAIGTQLCAAAC